jgi:hypothetical protein
MIESGAGSGTVRDRRYWKLRALFSFPQRVERDGFAVPPPGDGLGG